MNGYSTILQAILIRPKIQNPRISNATPKCAVLRLAWEAYSL